MGITHKGRHVKAHWAAVIACRADGILYRPDVRER